MKGVLIINTGSPKGKDRKDVEQFIGNMLSDPLVMTVPNWLRDILAKKIIAPLRAEKVASRYSQVWDDEQSLPPLIYHTEQLARKIEKETEFPVEIAMRYGEPNIEEALRKLDEKTPHLHEVVVLPLFPHYAQSSYQTVVDAIALKFYQKPYSFRLKIIEPFYDEPEYIHALAMSLKPFVGKAYDKLVFCFHSLPLSHEQKACSKGKQFDYVYQIKETVRLVTKELSLDPRKNRVVYSSAMSSGWLKPSLNEMLKDFPSQKIKKIIVIAPGFPADNLETLYDIDIKAKQIFLENGGVEFSFVHGLNSRDYWVDGIIKMITRIV